VKVAVLKNGTAVAGGDGYYTAAGYSTVGAEFSSTDEFKYRVKFELTGADLNSVLLATPVFDDITIYYQSGPVRFLSYNVVRL
jgi:hypothetical protein